MSVDRCSDSASSRRMVSDEHFEFNDDGTHLIALVDLDQSVAANFERACERLFESDGPEVVIDLSGINYMNSTSLGELILANDRASERKWRLRVRISERIVTIFDLLSLRDFIETEIVK